MRPTHANFLHNYSRIAVSSDCYLVLAQTNQKHRESFVLRIKVYLLKNGIRWIGCILKIEQYILPTLVSKLRLIVLLAQLAFGLLIGEKERVVLLTSFNFVIDPVLKALKVNVLHAAQAFTETDKRILSAV